MRTILTCAGSWAQKSMGHCLDRMPSVHVLHSSMHRREGELFADHRQQASCVSTPRLGLYTTPLHVHAHVHVHAHAHVHDMCMYYSSFWFRRETSRGWGSLLARNGREYAYQPPADPPRQAVLSCPAKGSVFFFTPALQEQV